MYQKMYFTIRGSYEYGPGFPDDNAADAFRTEIENLFRSAGWEVRPGVGHGDCARAFRGKESLYLHPMEISGVILRESAPDIEALLSQAKTFRHCQTYGMAEYVEMSDGEYREYLESRKEEIQAAILERFKTKRRNLFRVGDQSEAIARPFLLRRMETRNTRDEDMSVAYVRNLIEKMIADGRLTVSQTRYGRGIRTAGAVKASKKARNAGESR